MAELNQPEEIKTAEAMIDPTSVLPVTEIEAVSINADDAIGIRLTDLTSLKEEGEALTNEEALVTTRRTTLERSQTGPLGPVSK